LKVFQPQDFDYFDMLGSGAFGKVRKCKLKSECFEKYFGDLAGSTQDDDLQESDLIDEGEVGGDENMMDVDQTTSSSPDKSQSPVHITLGEAATSSNILRDEYSAVKLQSKYQLIKGKQEEHLLNEIRLMSALDHPLILKMQGVAQDKRIIYMYVDFMERGDLMGLLNKYR